MPALLLHLIKPVVPGGFRERVKAVLVVVAGGSWDQGPRGEDSISEAQSVGIDKCLRRNCMFELDEDGERSLAQLYDSNHRAE